MEANLFSLRLPLQVKAAPASPLTSAPAQITHQPKPPRMWLPAKVRHLVLVNHPPLLFPPSLSLSPPHLLSTLPIFGEGPACSRDNPKLKTNSQLGIGIRNPQRFCVLGGGEEGGDDAHSCFLIVEECLSKLSRYQAQSVARGGEGGTSLHPSGLRSGWRNLLGVSSL